LLSRSDREPEGNEGEDADDDGNCDLTFADDVDAVCVEEFCKRHEDSRSILRSSSTDQEKFCRLTADGSCDSSHHWVDLIIGTMSVAE